MDYSDFTVEELLTDTSFQEYCLGNDNESVLFWTVWIKDHPENQGVVKEAEQLYLILNGQLHKKEFKKNFELYTQRLDQHIGQHQTNTSTPPSRFNFTPYIIAASITLVMLISGLLFFHWSGHATNDILYASKSGEKRTITLKDGSIIILNGESSIQMNKDFNRSIRMVYLAGEAYFKIVHDADKPFIVQTKDLVVKDIGTVFNIRAFKDDRKTEATLIEGAIELTLKKDPDHIIRIRPNQKLVMEPDLPGKPVYQIITVTKNPLVNTIVETDWINNRLTFNDESFEDIAKKLERWYNVKIIFDQESIKNYRFVASFDNQNIFEVLDVLKLTRNFNYRKEGDIIKIY